MAEHFIPKFSNNHNKSLIKDYKNDLYLHYFSYRATCDISCAPPAICCCGKIRVAVQYAQDNFLHTFFDRTFYYSYRGSREFIGKIS